MENYDNDKPSKIIIAGVVAAILISFSVATYLALDRSYEGPSNTLVVGMNTPFPPFEYQQSGEIVGFDVDLANAIGEKINRKVVLKDFSDFAALIPAVETGAVDVVISGVTITPERDEAVDFSKPYYTASQAVLTTKDSNKFKGSGNLIATDFEGMSVGYQELTTSQTWIEANLLGQVNLSETNSFGDLSSGLQSMRLGAFDLIILDKPVADSFAKKHADLIVAGTIETNEQYGVVVKNEDPQNILPEINEVIEEMKVNGEYDELILKYFGGEINES